MSESSEKSNVAQFYAGKTIFITGGTGFLGLCLINKLLTSCPDIKTIYLLMRPKRGKEINERLETLTKDPIFEKLLQTEPADIFKKLRAVSGDVGSPDLGLSTADRKLLVDEVNLVFHSAATLDFEANLKTTVEINLLGTRRVLELAGQMKHIQGLCHVSSAYVNAWKLEAEEILYPHPEDADKVIEMVETLSDAALEETTPKLLKNHPNTYTFTKHLAEHEVNKSASKFPCVIVRPSMITAAWREPVPGWTISKNGPQGFLMGASKGVVRRLPVGTELVYDYIPVDIVVNELIVGLYNVAIHKSKELEIYQCTSSTYKPFKWSMVQHRINGYLHTYPLKSAVWYPHLKLVKSITHFKIAAFFVHMIPAIFLDALTRVFGGRPILVKLHTNVNKSLDRLEKFIFTEWKFSNKKTLQLHNSLNTQDKLKFNLDIKTLDWESYFIELTQGVRRYLNNETHKTLAEARTKDTILFFVHTLFEFLLLMLVWLLTAFIFGASMYKSFYVVPIFYILLNLL